MTVYPFAKIDNVVSHFAQLKLIAGEWNELYDENREQSIFFSFAYVQHWYECFAQPGEVWIYRLVEDGVTFGFFPLVRRWAFGAWILSGLTNDHCFHNAILVRHGCEERFRHLLVGELRQSGKFWELLRYNFTYSFAALPELFPEELVRGSGITQERYFQPTFAVRLRQPFNDYFRKDLSSNVRSALKRYLNKMNRSGLVRYICHEGEEALAHFGEFVAIEDSGWKGAAGSSIKRCGVDYQHHYRQLVRMLAERQLLRLYFLEYEQTLIAGLFGYLDGDTFHSLKIAYDERFKGFSPSNLLFIHIIELLTATMPELVRVHLFPWDGGYKHRFANEKVTCLDIVLFSPSWRGRVVRGFYAAKKWLRAFYTRGLA